MFTGVSFSNDAVFYPKVTGNDLLSMRHARHWVWLAVCLCQWAGAAISVNDDTGRTLTLAHAASRIVSLSPHATELLFAAGAGERVVGVANYSDYPPAARALPMVGSSERLNLEAIIALKPDLVVAWKSGNAAFQVKQLSRFGIPVFFSEPRRLEDIATNLQRLGTLAGSHTVAEAAARRFRATYREIGQKFSHRAPVRTFYQIWDQPLITVNGQQLISQVISLCGGTNIFAALGPLAPVVSREAVIAADPQVIIASGQGAERPEWLDRWRSWSQISAVKEHQLYVIEPDLIQRQTPRIVEGARIMCHQLQQARQAAAR